jgi:hypothetical protein
MALLYSKLSSFDPKISYRSRTLDELNSLCNVLNGSKSKLSNSLQYYLQKYSKLMDIPRLCRALAVPGELAEQFVEANKTKQYTDGLDAVTHSTHQIADILQSDFFYLHNDNGKDNNNNNQLIASDLNNNQKEAIHTDIKELAIYSKMYYDIETIKSDPLISGEYPYGNPFDHIIDIMKHGALIVRFKYVSNNKPLSPEEKVVSYHIMNFKGKDVLGVHVQDDQKFSMYKQWGHGDERLVPIYAEYENMIIRWGREVVAEAAMKGNKRNNDDGNNEFLY